jgi:hypothetical protein
VHRIDTAQRRARLAVRHRLAAASWAAEPREATDGVVALHSTDPASVFLSVYARTASVDPEAIERALYADRTLIRMLGMRRTMWVLPVELAVAVEGACTKAIAQTQWRLYSKILGEAGIGDREWLASVCDATARALELRGEATGAELAADEPRLRTQIVRAVGKPYESKGNITTWVLFLLAADGRIVRGRPRGTWASSQWRWSPVEAWMPGGIAPLPADECRVQLARRWLEQFGPGTAADVKWWTGWTMGQVKKTLAALKAEEVDLGDGATGLVLPGDTAPVAAEPEPWVAFLPALDPTAMGWSERSWYLGEHGPRLFDRSGNVGPTIWSDGRIVGGWAQRADGEVAYRLLEDVGREVGAEAEAAADRLTKWIGQVRVTPRFRTPLERELTA